MRKLLPKAKLFIFALISLFSTISFWSAVKYDYSKICTADKCPNGCYTRKFDECIPTCEKPYDRKYDNNYVYRTNLKGYFKKTCAGTPYSEKFGLTKPMQFYDECCEDENAEIKKVPWQSEYICCPKGTSWLYGKTKADQCCVGTVYDAGQGCCETPNKVATQICVSCKTCQQYAQQISDIVKTTNNTDVWPSESEIEKIQWEIKTIHDKYKAAKCDLAFKDKDYSACTPSDNWWGGDTSSSTDYNAGISCNQDQLILWQCKMNVYDTLSIRQSEWETSVGIFVQDIVLAATMFIGTIITIAIVISGLLFVFAWANEQLAAKAKSGIINAFIGLILVLTSYTIIRLIQYIAKGGE